MDDILNGFADLKAKERLDYIDFVKGLGMIFVVIHHHLLDVRLLTDWISSSYAFVF